MKCFSDDVRAMLLEIGIKVDIVTSIETTVEKLASYQVDVIELGNPATISERRRARNNLDVLRQGLLHRTISLAYGIGLLSGAGSVHGIALCLRGQLEATAQLGYVCHRLVALVNKKISFDDFHDGLANMLMSASHNLFTDAPKPLNVMTCFDKADMFLEKQYAVEKRDKMGVLRDFYDWLSDYCHPNFLSSASSFILDKAQNRMLFQHKQRLLPRNADLFTPMALNLDIFDIFWKHIDENEHILLDN
ncbi:hypothetical protein [Brucella pseudogrignonensis]|uniref:hypothetical protein n=1 Tax=Brucella pseudogrignonensis TaxID=419475 RepID=UPI003ECD00B7